jgi:ferritin-like metal-binding protein YciE
MPISSAEDLLPRKLQAIDDAEQQATRAMQTQIEEIDGELRGLIERRLKEGQRLRREVGKALKRLDGNGGAVQNRAARGLIEETETLLGEVEGTALRQAVLIDGLQSLEHYCIAAWGTVRSIAGQLGENELAAVMQSALDEGYEWDRAMTDLAEQAVNPIAAEGEEDDEYEAEDEAEDEDQGDTEQNAAEGGERGRARGSKEGGAGQAQGGSKRQGSAPSQGGPQKQGGSQRDGGGSSDLGAREYRDEQGQVHHHTHEYMQRNKGR